MAQRQNLPQMAYPLEWFVKDKHLYAPAQIEILAYLDYTVLEAFTPTISEKDIIPHLERTLQTRLTCGEVKEKLVYLWYHTGPPNAKASDYTQLFKRGSKALPLLKAEVADEVRRRARNLCISPPPRRLRSASCTPNSLLTPTTTRAVKRPRHRKRPKNKTARHHFITSKPVQTDHGIPSPPIEEQINPYVSTPQPRVKFERSLFEDSDGQSPTRNISGGASPLGDKRLEQTRRSSMTSTSSDMSVSSGNAITREDFEPSPVPSRYRSVETVLRSGLDNRQNLVNGLEDERDREHREIEYWRVRCGRAEQECIALKTRNHRLQVCSLEGLEQLDAAESTTLRKLNDQLKQELAIVRSTLAFSTRGKLPFPSVNTTTILDDMTAIRSKLRDVLIGEDVLFSFDRMQVVGHADFFTLFQAIFSVDCHQPVNASSIQKLLSGVPLRFVLQCLVSAAVCGWVLEADVGCLFQECDRVYSKLRGLLMVQDRELAQSFEFAAHQSVIDDPSMSDFIIPNKARYLAQKVLQCLAPLVENPGPADDGSPDLVTAWFKEKDRLIYILELALRIKTRLLISTDLYKCTWHASGTPFIADSMVPESDSALSSPGRGALVGFTLLPGIQRCSASERDFSYNRFVKDAQSLEAMTWEPLSKAVVLLM
ncbi:uncharacterized protein Z518_08733 [Rhinocladiella mackenziei CBS 650.93]|uniref:Uncharacterized protein n=1 Tax=Rhinocladiella mackenziei CBS 650.93 TaxID=1442369 RepID=A0A0D2IHL1_9EURO|nr:uncharacterized protein Z518_08733 [Rhinocladiella mackenziei CBS 650.93]KIX02791.1 hypothetical protein Z518_08733 [Rhinocladiella mackenziei CBS 650.93]